MKSNYKMIKAAIFDLDDTLLSTEILGLEAIRTVIGKRGNCLGIEDLKQQYGKGPKDILESLKTAFNISSPVEELLNERDKALKELFHAEELKLMPFAIEMLTTLKESGYKLAIATNGSRAYTQIKIQQSQLKKIEFDAIKTRSDVANGKPAPDVYLTVIRELRVEPNECIVFEDTETGITAAKRAGIEKIFAIPTELSQNQNFDQAHRQLIDFSEAIIELNLK